MQGFTYYFMLSQCVREEVFLSQALTQSRILCEQAKCVTLWECIANSSFQVR